MRTFGLIGYPLSHSFSQKYFTEKFKKENISDCEFKNFSIEDISQLQSILENNPTLSGLSVTIPHKQNVITLLDETDKAAKEIGAVNCVKIKHTTEGKIHLTGYNTDIFGFEKSLKPLLKPHHKKALILGAGGASKAIEYVLNSLEIKFKTISRTKSELSYSDITRNIIEEHTLIINTTPLGMFPNINEYPNIPYEFLSPKHLLYDLTYNPEETLFLKKGKEKGAQIKNGLEMLHLQAEKAWGIWQSPT